MTDDSRAARYFPFRKGPNNERVVRNAPDSDRSAQARAARRNTTHQITFYTARNLLFLPVLNAFTAATPYWLIGVIVTVVGLAIAALLYWIAARARDDIRLADVTIGIPLPDDLVDEIVQTGKSMHAIQTLFDLANADDTVYERVRRHQRQIRRLDELYVDRLQAARRNWVSARHIEWREAAAELPIIAHQTATLLASLSK